MKEKPPPMPLEDMALVFQRVEEIFESKGSLLSPQDYTRLRTAVEAYRGMKRELRKRRPSRKRILKLLDEAGKKLRAMAADMRAAEDETAGNEGR